MRLVVDARTSAFASLVDYAGVFPPASLTVGAAVEDYRAARASDAHWMLGRFLIRASQLHELAASATSTMARGESPWEVGVVFDMAPAQAASSASEFHAEMDPAMVVSAGEAKIADHSPSGIATLFTTVASVNPEIVPFLEVDREGGITDQVRSIGEVVATANRTGGAKVRCGGVTVDQFPSPEELGEFIVAAVQAKLPFKATAGLHQPVRHFDSELGVHRHGFVNILLATAAATAGEPQGTVIDILTESDPSTFRMSTAFGRWKDLTFPGSALRRVRQQRFIGYGSCDFDEPVEALTALGMIGEGS